MHKRYAFKRWRLHYQRLAELERLGLVHVIANPWIDNRARTKARQAARDAGIPWTREMDRAFRSPRKKTKVLNVTAEKRLEPEKNSLQSASDSQAIGKKPVKRTKRKA